MEVDGIRGDGGVDESAISTTQTHERVAEGQQLRTLPELAEILLLLEGKVLVVKKERGRRREEEEEEEEE